MSVMRNRLPKGCLTKKGNVWWCQWKHKGIPYGKSLDTTIKTEAESRMKTAIASIITDISKGDFLQNYGEPTEKPLIINNDIQLSMAWKAFEQSVNRPNPAKNTFKQYAYQFNTFIKWMKQNHAEITTVSGVKKVTAREFASHIGSNRRGNTFNKYINIMYMVFRTLNDTLDIQLNPWDNINRKRFEQMGRRPFSSQEVETILSKATGETLTLCLLGYHTGFRLEDCCRLEWREVDLDKRMITHSPFKTRSRRPNHFIKMHILDGLYHHLCELKKQASGKYVCPASASSYLKDIGIVSDRLQKFFKNVCGFKIHHDETGCDGRALVEIGFHSFRHHFVTRLKESGVDSAVVRDLVGWGSSQMEKTYTHFSDAHLTASIKKLDNLIAISSNPESAVEETMPLPPVALTNLSTVADDELAKTCKALLEEIERRKKAS